MKNGERKPDIYLVGTGVGGGLQFTVEAQRVLDRVGRAYVLHLPVPLRRHLRSLRIKTIDLSDRFTDSRPLGEAYVEVADFLLERAAKERPIVVLTPGSPLFLNSISRLVVLQARRSGLQVQTLPGISPLDALISYVGVDVATFGLQVFTGNRLASSPTRLDPAVPLAVMELAGVGVRASATDPADEPKRYVPLLGALAGVYPPNHPATLVNVTGGNGRRSHATLPLRRFFEFVPNIRENSHLFIDVIPPQQQRPAKEVLDFKWCARRGDRCSRRPTPGHCFSACRKRHSAARTTCSLRPPSRTDSEAATTSSGPRMRNSMAEGYSTNPLDAVGTDCNLPATFLQPMYETKDPTPERRNNACGAGHIPVGRLGG